MNEIPFKEYMLERGISKKWLSEKLDISRVALNYKLKGKHPFTVKEIKTIRDETQMSNEELITLFF